MSPPSIQRPRRLWHKRQSILYALHPDRIPAKSVHLTYTLGLGGISVLAALVAIVSGVLLTFYYVPTIDQAYASVTLLEDVVTYGSLIRALHYWSAQLLVVAATLHMARVVFTGAFVRPRRPNWLVGIALLVLTLLWTFSGYVLRWDESALWALLVGTNLIKEIPAWGSQLYSFLMGDTEVGPNALLRFYAWHVVGLTLIVGFGIVYHLFRLRKDGGISRRPLPKGEHRRFVPKEMLFYQEAVAAALVLAVLFALSGFVPAPLMGPALLDQPPARAHAPWFLLWVQELLRWVPAFWAGVAIPLLLILVLALIPWFSHQGRAGVWFDRRHISAQTTLVITAAFLFGLTIVALRR